jgi:hypothetical protein
LLRATRVHAARRDKRESQVVEEALRAHLGFDSGAELWQEPEQPAAAATSTDGAPQRSERVDERQVEPLPESEALALALAELHSLRNEER